jgi:Uma2 family endonuclease
MLTAMTSSSEIEPGMLIPTADQRIEIECGWEAYEVQLALRGERSRPKLAYLDGVLELMSPSPDHEDIKAKIGDIVVAYLVHADVIGRRAGGPTMRRKPANAGAEPDESFVFEDPNLDDKGRPIPDLVIEVNGTRGGIDKLEIYRRLGVREVWFWERNEILVYAIGGRGYVRQSGSLVLPGLDLKLVIELLGLDNVNAVHAAMKAALGPR